MALPMCRICASLKTHIVFFYCFICIEESAKSTALVYTHIHFAWKAYCCLLLTKHPSGIVLHNFTEQVLRYLILARLQRDQSQAALIKVLISAHWLLTVEIALPFSFRNHMPVCLPFVMMFLVPISHEKFSSHVLIRWQKCLIKARAPICMTAHICALLLRLSLEAGIVVAHAVTPKIVGHRLNVNVLDLHPHICCQIRFLVRNLILASCANTWRAICCGTRQLVGTLLHFVDCACLGQRGMSCRIKSLLSI